MDPVHVSLSSLSLAGPRPVTREDMRTVLSRAAPPGEYSAASIVSVVWEVDGEPVDSPLKQCGRLLAARVGMVLER